MKPMLLKEYPCYQETIEAEDYVFIQPKLNGWRCVINTRTGKLYSRTEKEIILPHISDDIINTDFPEWLDGELYLHGYSLDRIMSMIKTNDSRIKFYCFDVITAGNFSERLEILEGLWITESIRTVSTAKIKPCEIDRYYSEYLKIGLEGAVIRLDRPYENKRSENIFKLKPNYTF